MRYICCVDFNLVSYSALGQRVYDKAFSYVDAKATSKDSINLRQRRIKCLTTLCIIQYSLWLLCLLHKIVSLLKSREKIRRILDFLVLFVRTHPFLSHLLHDWSSYIFVTFMRPLLYWRMSFSHELVTVCSFLILSLIFMRESFTHFWDLKCWRPDC